MSDNERICHEPGMSVTIGKLSSALSKFQSEVEQPKKSQVAKVPMKSGGSYSYRYADLADCIRVAQPLLLKHELAVIQTVNTGKGWVSVRTIVSHGSGEFILDVVTLPVGDDKPQSYGSAITYARRYGYCAPLGISPDEDEDGNIAQDAKQPEAKQRPQGEKQQGSAPAPVPIPISEKQVKRLFAIASQRGWTEQEVANFVKTNYKVASRKQIPVIHYDEIIKTRINSMNKIRRFIFLMLLIFTFKQPNI
jgi:hypothetical protein